MKDICTTQILDKLDENFFDFFDFVVINVKLLFWNSLTLTINMNISYYRKVIKKSPLV
jgi:hypothetical protein